MSQGRTGTREIDPIAAKQLREKAENVARALMSGQRETVRIALESFWEAQAVYVPKGQDA